MQNMFCMEILMLNMFTVWRVNGTVLLKIQAIKLLNAIIFLLCRQLLHLWPRRITLPFGTFSHQNGCFLRRSHRNQNFVNGLRQWMDKMNYKETSRTYTYTHTHINTYIHTYGGQVAIGNGSVWTESTAKPQFNNLMV